jgi:hypothetical protein
VSGVADQAQHLSQRLSGGGLDGTLADARRVARNRPGMFLAGAALAGFIAARVVRVADTDRLKEAATGATNASGQGALGSGAGTRTGEPALDPTSGATSLVGSSPYSTPATPAPTTPYEATGRPQ